MFRKDYIALLLNHPMTIHELASLLDESPQDVEDALEHLFKSIRNTEYRAVISPARCRRCGFTFRRDKLHKPGKCPACKGTWIREPRLEIEKSN